MSGLSVGGHTDDVALAHAAPGILRTFPELGEIEEYPARYRLLVTREPPIDDVGVVAQRATQPPNILIRSVRQAAVLTPQPELLEGVLEQRKIAGLVANIGEDRVDQPWLRPNTGH